MPHFLELLFGDDDDLNTSQWFLKLIQKERDVELRVIIGFQVENIGGKQQDFSELVEWLGRSTV